MVGSILYKEAIPFVAMVVLEVLNVGVNTLFKAATAKGMSYHVFIVYSYVLSAILLLPSSLFLHRKIAIPPLNSRIIGKFLCLGLLGTICLLFAYKGIEDSSPTLASAISNLIPAFTFILAITFRMENLAWRTFSGQAKILGTVVSITGALVIILYKGPSIMSFPSKSSLNYYNFLRSPNSKWIIGGVLLGADYILTPVWYILQAHTVKEYPAEFIVAFFYSAFAALISGAISSVAEPDRAVWILKPDISLVAIVYSGVVEALCCGVHVWILRRKGPFYVAMFKPLSIAIAAGMGVILLGDTLYLGSIIGAVVITLGFYSLMWGKTTEDCYEDLGYADPESSSYKAPLLQDLKSEDS